ncbi:hypothetical protein MNL08_07070 [Bartonella krasnovii]|nr:hypothetical protein [Bartonella krasnovii]UNF41918.1 hypothetical protein MNL08_07070 [Bartonella krasnovii]UNF45159.1 hypothetical protein MNL06_06315 [Bartonella krasnovii]UNF51773.1 hypothetical protein MNL02_06890 [Bartonella krasnovii]
MKGKNSTFYNKLLNFFEKEYSFVREYFVICLLSLMIELGNRIFFLPSLEQGNLTGGQASSLFHAVCALWTIIGVGFLVLTPVMVILCIILWRLLVKNTRKLNKINEQQGRITPQQKDRDKKGVSVKMDEILVTILCFVLMFVTVWFAAMPVWILQLYYGVFKLARRYRCLKQELKSLLKEQEIAFEKS